MSTAEPVTPTTFERGQGEYKLNQPSSSIEALSSLISLKIHEQPDLDTRKIKQTLISRSTKDKNVMNKVDPEVREKVLNKSKKKDEEIATKFQKVKTIQRNNKTYYVVEGDVLLSSEEYNNWKSVKDTTDKLPTYLNRPSSLLGMVNRFGQYIRWDPVTSRNLTYSIDEESFRGQTPSANAIRRGMLIATTDWSRVCGVTFTEVQENALFTVVYDGVTNEPGLMASAFFPDSPPEDRNLVIYRDFTTTGFNQAGILRHEIGHILGFRHEHIRHPALRNWEPNDNIYELTRLDTKSVMHYFLPPYGGTKEGLISTLDAQGAAIYYGPPLDEFGEFNATGRVSF